MAKPNLLSYISYQPLGEQRASQHLPVSSKQPLQIILIIILENVSKSAFRKETKFKTVTSLESSPILENKLLVFRKTVWKASLMLMMLPY